MENLIQEILERNKIAGERTRIMEIGAGNGRVLMTLKKMFPEAEFYGINKEKTITFYRRESFMLTALKFNIATKEEVEGLDLPYIVFQDLDFGGTIPYDDNKFDLIYSQSTIPNIKYKFELFDEIMRVLKKGGLSVHTDVSYLNVYRKGVVMDFRDALKEIRKRGIEIYQLENPSTLKFKKPGTLIPFPVTPHQAIPEINESLTAEQRRPEMGYNLTNE
jgi:ubiquinone/menaquinone biosynthesis C-methylase UbiE